MAGEEGVAREEVVPSLNEYQYWVCYCTCTKLFLSNEKFYKIKRCVHIASF